MQDDKTQNGKGLGVASLVTSLLGLYLVGIILGILGMQKAKKVNQTNGLAIAGIIISSVGTVLSLVILLIVFVSVPTLQRNSRDTQRQSDIARLANEVVNFENNNNGQLPKASDLPTNLTIVKYVSENGSPSTDTALYIAGKNCGGVAGDRNYSITILFEKGTTSCVGS